MCLARQGAHRLMPSRAVSQPGGVEGSVEFNSNGSKGA